jgi:hypothetical protein
MLTENVSLSQMLNNLLGEQEATNLIASMPESGVRPERATVPQPIASRPEEMVTPEEDRQALISALEHANASANAPLAREAQTLAAQGRGMDTMVAHVAPGEVVLPPEVLEDDAFTDILDSKLASLGYVPEERVVGAGLGPVNPQTGLPEYFSIKKALRKVAKVASFVPGPWQSVANLADKAYTVYDVAKGRSDPLSLLTVAGPLRTGPSILDSLGGIRDITRTGQPGAGGIIDLFRGEDSAFGGKNILENIRNVGAVSQYEDDYEEVDGVMVNKYTGLPITEDMKRLLLPEGRSGDAIRKLTQPIQTRMLGTAAENNRLAAQEYNALLTSSGGQDGIEPVTDAQGRTTGYRNMNTGEVYEKDAFEDLERRANAFKASPAGGYEGSATTNTRQGVQDFVRSLGAEAGSRPTSTVGKAMEFLFGKQAADKGILNTLFGLGGSGGGPGIGGLLSAGLPAVALAKLAMDETRKDKGVPLTPLTTMGPTGRYNIEAEIARRMGQEAPNPVEFGLLPRGTFPALSGGRALPSEGGDPRRPAVPSIYAQQYHMGGIVPLEYANGGTVAMEDFVRMNGDIDGPGTETSDDVPAMLSDGEFVMTGRAVRGAGAYSVANNNGIVTLSPTGEPGREAGTNTMYQIMDLFEGVA